METKLNMVPEKLDRVTLAIDDSKNEYEQLLKLKPISTIVSFLSSAAVCFTDLTALVVCCCACLMSDRCNRNK